MRCRIQRNVTTVTGCLWLVMLTLSTMPGRVQGGTEPIDLCLPNANPCRVTTNITVQNMSDINLGNRDLLIDSGGTLNVGAGQMTLRAARVTVAANGELRARGPASEIGGTIVVEADEITIAGRVDATGGDGGQITLTSEGNLTVTGTIIADRISNEGGGGEINLEGANVSVSGMISAFGGTLGFGGDVIVGAHESVTMTGNINVEGGDGGSVELNAGIEQGNGNVTLTAASVVDADARGAGGFGGSIDLDANGDGTDTGNVTANGLLTASGGAGTEETGGGDGGAVGITAVGNVLTDNSSASMLVEGARPDGFGGEVEVFSTGGGWDTNGRISIGPAGDEGGGGDLTADTKGDIDLRGRITGPGGSEVLFESSEGTITVVERAEIDMSDTGSICLSVGLNTVTTPTRVVVSGRLTANGGSIELTAPDAVVISESGTVRADGAQAGGDGGSVAIIVDAGQALVNSVVSTRGRGNGSAGGMITIDATERANVGGRLDASGAGGVGGEVTIRSNGPISIAGIVVAPTVANGMGGLITLESMNDVNIAGTLESNGGPAAGSKGGMIDIEGCTVTIENAGELSNLRPSGINRITGRQATVVRGDMLADNLTGRNEFRFNGQQHSPLITGQVTPLPSLVMDVTIVPCVVCGNDQVEPPEECDDGNQVSGDGCSSSCQEEVIIPGDTNGDEIVDAADLSALVAEIFDGDGDAVADVGDPTFPGAPGADANDDDRITAADIVGTLAALNQ